MEVPVEVTLNCPLFSFEYYPFDTQLCELYIGNYWHATDEMLYKGTLNYNSSHQRPLQYDVKEVRAMPFEYGFHNWTNYMSSNGEAIPNSIEYSYFVVKMEFKRRVQPFLLRTYLPSVLLVSCSWIGFLIDPASVPGRIALSVTLFLVLINMR